jgi:hypothetical protein
MSGMLRLRRLDRQSIAFEAAVSRLGEKTARKAFARALNHETRKAHTAVKRKVRVISSIRTSHIAAAIKFHKAGDETLTTVIKATGAPIPLRYFGPRQFKYGVRATVWGKPQRFKSAFIVKSLAGGVFKNTGGYNAKQKRFNAIEKMYGPSIPKEMMTETVVNTFMGFADNVSTRAMHEITHILRSA